MLNTSLHYLVKRNCQENSDNLKEVSCKLSCGLASPLRLVSAVGPMNCRSAPPDGPYKFGQALYLFFLFLTDQDQLNLTTAVKQLNKRQKI